MTGISLQDKNYYKWKNLLGTVEITHNYSVYTIMIGYVFNDPGILYFRIWENGYFIAGTWKDNIIKNGRLSEMPSEVKIKCLELAERIEKLKAFI